MPIPFEDEYTDVISKAQRGLGLKNIELMMRSGVSMIALEDFLKGNFNPETSLRIAEILELDPQSLALLAENKIGIASIECTPLTQWVLPFPNPSFPDQTVNAYTLELRSGANILIDTGLDLTPVIEGYASRQLNPPAAILITHHHHDHIEGMTQAQQHWPQVPIYAPEAHLLPSSKPFPDPFIIAGQTISIRATPGHRPEAVTFLCENNNQRLAFSADTIFAASIGGIPQKDYIQGLQTIREQILNLPPETILCPGHGPLTTVAAELKSNPFFAHNKGI